MKLRKQLEEYLKSYIFNFDIKEHCDIKFKSKFEAENFVYVVSSTIEECLDHISYRNAYPNIYETLDFHEIKLLEKFPKVLDKINDYFLEILSQEITKQAFDLASKAIKHLEAEDL